MRVVFMGSPAFAVPCLQALAAAHDVALVVSQPDKPAGRGAKLTPPDVKVAAEALGLPILQPRSAKTGELAAALAASGAELCVVVAYGKILPPAVLEAVPRGCINVHGSILPRWRGAAPVQWAVIEGDAETGVAVMQLDAGMDTGPVYLERKVAIDPDETAGELLARLAPIGAAAMLDAVAAIAAGTARAVDQDHTRATHARMLDKTDGAIDFAQPAARVASRIRGVDPWPGAYAMHRGDIVKLFRARAVLGATGAPGTVTAIDKTAMIVTCGDGNSVAITEIQAAGRKRMLATQFAAGRGIAARDVLTKSP